MPERSDTDKYALYKLAKKSGGPCDVCGWSDGDGVKTCFYSQDLGEVTHQNSERGVMATMTEPQRHLYSRRQTQVFISEELREQYISEVSHRHLLRAARYRAQEHSHPFTADEHGREITDGEWIANFSASQLQKEVATDPQYTGWLSEPWWVPVEYESINYTIPKELRGIEQVGVSRIGENEYPYHYTAYMTHIYEPHSCGKGHATQPEPYVIACTGCDTVIKLWEHGVDYDMG